MKILWLGVGFSPKQKEVILNNNGKILSAQVSETNIIDGIDALNISMDTLNGPNMSTRIFDSVFEEEWSRNGTSRDIGVGYRNIKYLNIYLKEKALCAAARKWALENKQYDEIVVFIYSMHTPLIAAALEVKKILPHAKICQIVLDLPQYMDLKMGRMKKLLKAVDWKRIQKYMKKIDKYVLYAEPMADFLGLQDGQWMVMEGSFNSTQLADADCKPDPDKISVMYSGVLDLRYGIPELLDAMKLLDDTYELWLTGAGNAEDLIRQRAATDERIKFYGYLPSRQDLLNKQAQATMLISPRRDTEEASKYCFPSKLFEYMVSGRPVISCFLAGIPAEYHNHLIELPSASAQEIAAIIKKTAKLSAQERSTIGSAAKKFVLENKNKFAQAKKIAEFMDIV